MYDELAQKDKVIEQLHINLKHYEKLEKKDMKSDIYKREIDANAKINVLSEELIHLKKKLQEKEGGKKGEGNLLGMHHRGSDTMIVNDSVGKNCVTKQK